MDKRICERPGLKALILLSPIILLLHSLEEAISLAAWIGVKPDKLPPIFRSLLLVSPIQFFIASGIIFTAYCIIALIASRARQASPWVWLYIVASAMIFVNGFTHIGQFIIVQGYIPGILTALLMVLPYYGRLLHRIHSSILPGKRLLRTALLLGLVLQPPLLMLLHGLSRLLSAK